MIKVFVVTADDKVTPLDANWMTIGDAASDIDGGDFWTDVGQKFPDGCVVKEIRIVPEEPVTVSGDGDDSEEGQ